mmetsp:Transcript_53677/g.170697  ORF Transcript_53677/g.170697 Transcript_53677/m.170697 type:complete len:210 (+) Transcript_53677:2085-2714(+)
MNLLATSMKSMGLEGTCTIRPPRELREMVTLRPLVMLFTALLKSNPTSSLLSFFSSSAGACVVSSFFFLSSPPRATSTCPLTMMSFFFSPSLSLMSMSIVSSPPYTIACTNELPNRPTNSLSSPSPVMLASSIVTLFTSSDSTYVRTEHVTATFVDSSVLTSMLAYLPVTLPDTFSVSRAILPSTPIVSRSCLRLSMNVKEKSTRPKGA